MQDSWNDRIARGLNRMVTADGVKVVNAKLDWYHTSRLDNLIRTDGRAKRARLHEVLEIARATSHRRLHPEINDALAERFGFILVDLERYERDDRARGALIDTLRRLTDLIEADDYATSPDSDGGVERTANEVAELNRLVTEAMQGLSAYRAQIHGREHE
jgi:hypothetical protein